MIVFSGLSGQKIGSRYSQAATVCRPTLLKRQSFSRRRGCSTNQAKRNSFGGFSSGQGFDVDNILQSNKEYQRVLKKELKAFKKGKNKNKILLTGTALIAAFVALGLPFFGMIIIAPVVAGTAVLALPLVLGSLALLLPVAILVAVALGLAMFSMQLAFAIPIAIMGAGYGLMAFVGYQGIKFITQSSKADEGEDEQPFGRQKAQTFSDVQSQQQKSKKSKEQIHEEELLRAHKDSLKEFDDLLDRSDRFKK